MLASLAILGDARLEFTDTTGNDENSTVSLGGASNHVLDKITVTRGVNDSNHKSGGLELPEGDIDGDTALTLGFQLVKHPSIFERAFPKLSGLLLEFLNGTLIDTTTLVDQVTSCRGLARIDMADDDDIDVSLLLAHFFR